MNKLIEIGECLVDISMIVSVEPYARSHQLSRKGAKVTLTNGSIVFEEKSSLREVKDKIQAAVTPSDRAGWKLVPLEPTPEMIEAALDLFNGDTSCVKFGDVYAAMLAAAPAEKAK